MPKKSVKRNKRAAVKKPGFSVGDYSKPLVLIIPLIVIVLTGILMYVNTLDYNFVYCDDNILVIDHQNYNNDPGNILASFERPVGASYYRPVLASSFIIDNALSETGKEAEPYAYRRTNLILHITASVLVFILLYSLSFGWIESFISGMLFVLHPILTPGASWISARNDSMIAIFVILSIIFFLNYLKQDNLKQWIWLPLHLIAFMFSLYTKEIAAMLPILGIIYFLVNKDKPIFHRKHIILTSFWLVIGFVWYAMRNIAISKVDSPDSVGLDAFIKNFPTALALPGKIILPIKMIALSNFELFTIATGILVLISLGVLIYISRDKIKMPVIVFGFSWYLLFLLPSFMVRIAYVDDFFDYAEHRAYLPMVGIIIIVLELLRANKINFRKPIPVAIASVLILVFAYRSYSYQPVFENRKTFWKHMTDIYPEKSRGYLDLGKAYYMNNDLDSAEICYKKGIELNPENFNLYIDLSAVYMRKNEPQNAVAYAKKAIKLDSANTLAWYNLGKSLIPLGRYEDAALAIEKSLIKNNIYPHWYVDLGVTYYQTGRYKKSIETYYEALKRNPNMPLAYTNLGASYAKLADYDNAEKSWLKAIELAPKMWDAYHNLVRLYYNTDRKAQALKLAEKIQSLGGPLPKGLKIVDKKSQSTGQ